MARSDLSANSPVALVGTLAGGKILIAPAGIAVDADLVDTAPHPLPIWIKLVRVRNAVAGFISTDGTSWRLTALTALGSTNRLFAGPAVTSNQRNSLSDATFKALDVQPVSEPVLPDDFNRILLAAGVDRRPGTAPTAVQIAVASRPGDRLVIEASEDFVLWQAIGALTNTLGITSITQPLALQDKARFFRARRQ